MVYEKKPMEDNRQALFSYKAVIVGYPVSAGGQCLLVFWMYY